MNKISGKELINASKIASDALGWVNRIHETLQPFKPTKKRFKINYQNRSAEIKILVNNLSGLSKKWRKIVIPASQGFTLTEVLKPLYMDMEFIDPSSIFDGKNWKINPSKLNTDALLFTLEGNISEKALNSLVRVQPSINRDRTDEVERYWLSSMIKDAEIWEDLWNILEIENVSANVELALSSILKGIFPNEVKNLLEATTKFVKAGEGKDRTELFNAWRERRLAKLNSKLTPSRVVEIIKEISQSEFLGNYLRVDQPYRLGIINPHSDIINMIPKFVNVDTITNLSLKSPTSTGYLSFNKSKFSKEVLSKLED